MNRQPCPHTHAPRCSPRPTTNTQPSQKSNSKNPSISKEPKTISEKKAKRLRHEAKTTDTKSSPKHLNIKPEPGPSRAERRLMKHSPNRYADLQLEHSSRVARRLARRWNWIFSAASRGKTRATQASAPTRNGRLEKAVILQDTEPPRPRGPRRDMGCVRFSSFAKDPRDRSF